MPAEITAVASCSAATGLAPPIGTIAEKRMSWMPKASMKSSVSARPFDIGITPSISPGWIPASRTAASEAWSCRARLLCSETPRVYAVSPTPVTAAAS
jgi:hypothetical protein